MSVVSGRQGILLPAGFGFRCLAFVSAHFGNRQQVPSHLGGGAGGPCPLSTIHLAFK